MTQGVGRFAAWRAGFVGVAAVLAACSEHAGSGTATSTNGTDPSAASSPSGSASGGPVAVVHDIGSAGGSVIDSNGTGVVVPAGALQGDIQISVTAAPGATPPAGTSALGTPAVFEPNGVKFAAPVTVVIAFDPAKLPAGTTAADIVVYTAPDGTNDYQALHTVVRDATHVAAETTHFCVFVPVIPPKVPAGDKHPDSADGGTSGDGGSSSDGGACAPVLCGFYGPGTCGSKPDRCGKTLDCGSCQAGSADGGPPPSGPGDAGDDQITCIPLTCAQYAFNCGIFPNGCSGIVDCGTCSVEVVVHTPHPNPTASASASACVPTTCGPGMCGNFPDACVGTIFCSDCGDAGSATPPPPQTSGGDDDDDCVPKACEPLMCGIYEDGCGGDVTCSDCGGPP